MLEKTIKYTDYNGEEREETFLFNLSKAELTEWELTVEGGLTALITKISSEKRIPELTKLFKSLIMKAYGEKSPDGKRFIKSEDLSIAFTQTGAYDELFMSFFDKENSGKNVSEFIAGILPGDLLNDSKVQALLNSYKE